MAESTAMDVAIQLPSVTYSFTDTAYGRSFMTSLSTLRNTNMFTDVTLKTEDLSIPCHKVALSAASPYFMAMFNSGLEESTSDSIEIKGIDGETLMSIVEYIYSTDMTITTSNVQNLIQACELFHFTGLKHACERFMLQQVDPFNCIGFYKFSKLYSLQCLRNGARQCMLKMFKSVASGNEFREMSSLELIEYISDDNLDVRTEDPVFDAVLAWIHQNPDNEQNLVEDIISNVRFPFCSSAYLCYVVDRNSIFTDMPLCKTYIDQARLYHMLPEKRHEMKGVQITPRESFGNNRKLVVIGGLTKDEKENRFCWYLKEDSNTWELLAQLPKPNWKFYSICVVQNNGILVSGGYHGNVKRECWLFDTSEKKWKPMAPMLDVRCKHRTVVHGNSVYLVGGEDDFDRPLSSMERFDWKVKRWDAVPPMDKALSDPLVVSHGRHIYVFAGIENNDATSTSTAAFDTVWDTWSPRAEMPEPCRLGAAVAVNDMIYLVAGYSKTCLGYNTITDQWVKLSRPREKHGNAPAITWQGKVLVGGGDVDMNETTSVVEEYDPEKDMWSYWKIPLKEELSCHYMLNVELTGL